MAEQEPLCCPPSSKPFLRRGLLFGSLLVVPTQHPSQSPAFVSACLLVEIGDLETESMPLETQGGGSFCYRGGLCGPSGAFDIREATEGVGGLLGTVKPKRWKKTVRLVQKGWGGLCPSLPQQGVSPLVARDKPQPEIPRPLLNSRICWTGGLNLGGECVYTPWWVGEGPGVWGDGCVGVTAQVPSILVGSSLNVVAFPPPPTPGQTPD